MKSLNKSKDSIEAMFNSIAHNYDFIGHFFSLGIDRTWRKKAVKSLDIKPEDQCLDVACGTGDLCFYLAKKNPEKIIGIDISEEMLKIAKQKYTKGNFKTDISFIYSDAEEIPFPDETFDIVTIAFGVRNFHHPEKALSEIKRILKNNGQIMILELTVPEKHFGKFYKWYITKIMPRIANTINRKAKIYRYLPESIAQFTQGNKFLDLMNLSGYSNCTMKPFSFGIATMYKAFKINKSINNQSFSNLEFEGNNSENMSLNIQHKYQNREN